MSERTYTEILDGVKNKSWTEYRSDEAALALSLLKKALKKNVNDIEIMIQLVNRSPAGIWKISSGSCATGCSISNESDKARFETHIAGEIGRIDDRGNCY